VPRVMFEGEPLTPLTRRSTLAASRAAGAAAVSAARTTIRSNLDMNLSLDFANRCCGPGAAPHPAWPMDRFLADVKPRIVPRYLK